MLPIRLAPNQPPERFYRGGSQIAAFRGTRATASRVPEDWVASTSPLFGESELGQTRLADGRLLAEHIRENPAEWLGERHVAAWGDDPALLVKLLDAGERLPAHAHPDVAFSARHLGLRHGKTEAWIMLRPAPVYLGFSREIELSELRGWVDRQDVEAMLGAMNELRLEEGDTVLVPAGLPHAIGNGAFLVELQEPTDLSILLEWRDFAIDGTAAGHLGLGFDTALAAIDRSAWDRARVTGLRWADAATEGRLFPQEADPFFRAERHTISGRAEIPEGYCVLVVTSGSGSLSATGGDMAIAAGDTVLVPFGAGDLAITGDLAVLRCLPPLPPESQRDSA